MKSPIVLCQARKSRDADHLTNYVYDREMIDAKQLLKAIMELRENPENIELPDCTFDVHTRKVGAKARSRRTFFKRSSRHFSPREPGEFDWTVE